MRAALFITLTFFAIELAGGLASRSLALVADAAHMFTDVASLVLSYAAMTLADRSATDKHTFGLFRAEILAAFVNALVLLTISGYIFYEAYRRFRKPPEIRTGLMLWVAVAGLLANFVSWKLLRSGRGQSLNVKAAYLEVVTDLLGSLGVVGGALLIRRTGWLWVDPVISAGIGVLILPRTVSILKESAHILLEGSPEGIDVSSFREKILEIPGVAQVHDLHFWTLTSGVNSASVHVALSAQQPADKVLSEIQKRFKENAGVDHATIQVEAREEDVCPPTDKHR
jgi:cobalt-zinc-cadmium efflux system protein